MIQGNFFFFLVTHYKWRGQNQFLNGMPRMSKKTELEFIYNLKYI